MDPAVDLEAAGVIEAERHVLPGLLRAGVE
jgi:hypothetical protein